MGVGGPAGHCPRSASSLSDLIVAPFEAMTELRDIEGDPGVQVGHAKRHGVHLAKETIALARILLDHPPGREGSCGLAGRELELHHLVDAGYPSHIVLAVDSISHRTDESYDEYIDRVAKNAIARRVKLADLEQNLANNRRLPPPPGAAERIARYERAITRLGSSS